MNSGAFGYVDVLKTAADASWLREEVLTNNIANVDTPNYKRQVNEANLSGITTRTYTENTTLSYRMDGNNVDLSTENAELAAEQINYNALIDSMNNEFTRMKAVLK